MPLSAQDPYFTTEKRSPDGLFLGFKKYGTIIPSHIIAEHIAEAINDRLIQKSLRFEYRMDSFTQAMENNPIPYHSFLELLDDVRVDGVYEVITHRKPYHQYHTAEHSVELAYDVQQVLAQKLKNVFPKDTVANAIFVALTKAAASWHDVEQKLGPPKNEIHSANMFAKLLKKRVDEFKNKYHGMDDAIENFKDAIDFLSRELIVYATWLVIGVNENKKVVTKTLRQYIEIAVRDIQENFQKDYSFPLKMGDGPYMQRLLLAGKTMSQGDTTRFSFDHVLNSNVLLDSLHTMPDDIKKPLEDFFVFANLNTDVQKEVFLGLHCQDLRMFTELNLPFTPELQKLEYLSIHAAHISENDYIQFIKAFDANRHAHHASDDIDYIHLLDLFINTKNVKPNPQNEKRNIDRERIFAASLENDIWKNHANYLILIDQYISQLDEVSRCNLSKALFALATRFQPGLKLLLSDKKIRARLERG